MSQVRATPHHSRACAGCLGSGACWVCLGTGKLMQDHDRRISCHRCHGSGLCGEELDRVVALPGQRPVEGHRTF